MSIWKTSIKPIYGYTWGKDRRIGTMMVMITFYTCFEGKKSFICALPKILHLNQHLVYFQIIKLKNPQFRTVKPIKHRSDKTNAFIFHEVGGTKYIPSVSLQSQWITGEIVFKISSLPWQLQIKASSWNNSSTNKQNKNCLSILIGTIFQNWKKRVSGEPSSKNSSWTNICEVYNEWFLIVIKK